MSWTAGSLVRARGRDWVVLPDSTHDLLLLRPLGGGADDIAGVLPDLEPVESATFAPPDPDDLGDAVSARLLRSASVADRVVVRSAWNAHALPHAVIG